MTESQALPAPAQSGEKPPERQDPKSPDSGREREPENRPPQPTTMVPIIPALKPATAKPGSRGNTPGKSVRFPPDQELTDVRLISPRVLSDVGDAPFQRCWHVSFSADRGMYVFGGVFFTPEKQLVAMNDMHSFDWDTAKWRKVSPKGDVPHECWAMSCASVAEQQGTYLLGGRDKEYVVSSTLWRFDAENESWSKVSDSGPRMCAGGMSCVGGTVLVAFGGIERFADRKASGAVYSNRTSVFDAATGQWREQPTRGAIPSPRAWHAQCAIDAHRILVYGGTDSLAVFNELFLLDTRTWTWHKPDQSGDLPPHSHSSVLTRRGHEKGVAFLHGGGVPYFNDTADGIRAVILDDSGTKLSVRWVLFRGNLAIAPVIFGHTAASRGPFLFFFGGQSTSRYHNDIWMVDALYGDPAPPPRPPGDLSGAPQQRPSPGTKRRSHSPKQSPDRGAPSTTASPSTSPLPSPKSPRNGLVHECDGMGAWKESYELVKKVGRGGFSTILLVKEIKTGTLFAAKRSNLAAATSETRLRALREVKIHSSFLPHPFLVRFHEAFVAKGSRESFIAMEWCPGGDLYSRLRDCSTRKSRIPEGTIAEWFTAIVLAVAHLHKQGLVHGDLKSANVLFAEDGSVRVCDFGMTDKPAAPHRQQALRRLHEVNGTPDYMSPESLPPTFGPPSPATDMWAAGVLLYEMAALRLPFGGDGGGGRGLEDTAERIIKHPHDPLPGGCSAALEATISALLSKKPSGRPLAAQLLASPFCSQAIPTLQAHPSCSRFSLS